MDGGEITLSVVSHAQNGLVNSLLQDIRAHCSPRVRVVITENIPDTVPLSVDDLACPTKQIANSQVKGFGANHNAAFALCETPYFCVCNPDVRLTRDPFDPLLQALARKSAGAVGPLVRNPAGTVEDSARRFPTVLSLLQKSFVRNGPDYPTDRGAIEVDWVAGMFMLFPSRAYRDVRGFDEAYFLYYEDIDICRRLGQAGRSVLYVPDAEIFHDARRGSRRNPALMRHHLRSVVRYFTRY